MLIAGRRVNGASPDELARRGLCLIPEGRGIFPNLTVRENLWMMTYGGALAEARSRRPPTSASPGCGERRTQIAGTLSGGEQQMLALARGLVDRPRRCCCSTSCRWGWRRWSSRSSTVGSRRWPPRASPSSSWSSSRTIVLGVADRAAVMVNGRVVHEGTPDEVESTLSRDVSGSGAPAAPTRTTRWRNQITDSGSSGQFKQEISADGGADPATSRDRTLLILGAVRLIVGPAVAIAGYF